MLPYTLFITYPEGRTELRTFDAERVTIGRSEGEIVLGDPHASGRHAEITRAEGKLWFRDLGSSNGSFLGDGNRVTAKTELVPGMVFLLGKSRIEVRSVGASVAATQLLGGTMFAAELGKAKQVADANMVPPPYVESAPIPKLPFDVEVPNADLTPSTGSAAASSAKAPAAARGSAPAAGSAGPAPEPAGAAGSASPAGAGPKKPGFFGRLFGKGAGAGPASAAGGGGAAGAGPPAAGSAAAGAASARGRAPEEDAAMAAAAAAGVPASEIEAAYAPTVMGGNVAASVARNDGRTPATGDPIPAAGKAASAGSGGAASAGGGAAPAAGGAVAPKGASPGGAVEASAHAPGGGAAKPGGGISFGSAKGALGGAFAGGLLGTTDGTPKLAAAVTPSTPFLAGAIEAIKDAIQELKATFVDRTTFPKGFAELLAQVKQAALLVSRCWLQAALVMAVLTIPVAVSVWLATILGFLSILVTILSLASGLLSMFGIAALVLLVTRAELGLRTSALAAWKSVLRDPIKNWIALFASGLLAGLASILLLIPGFALGAFSTVAFVVEGRRFVDANRRSLETWRRGRLGFLLGALLIAVLGAAISIPIGIVCGLIPFVGPLVGGLLAAVINATTAAVFVAYTVQRWFALRRAEGDADPEASARAALG